MPGRYSGRRVAGRQGPAASRHRSDATKGAVGVRQQFSQEDHSWSQTIERLDRVSRAMNPLLLFIAVSLVVLNLAFVVNLIDWRTLPQTPAGSEPAARTVAAHASGAPASLPR